MYPASVHSDTEDAENALRTLRVRSLNNKAVERTPTLTSSILS